MSQETNIQSGFDSNSGQSKSKTGIILSVALGIVILAAIAVVFSLNSNIKNQKDVNSQLTSENLHLNNTLTNRDSVMNDMMATFDQIENDLSVIKSKRNLLTIQSNDPEFRQDKRQAILKDIQMLNTLIEESKTRLASLSKKLKDSGVKIQQLEEKMTAMNTMLEARDADINDLKKFLQEKDFQVADLNKHLDSIQVVQVNSQNVIQQQEAEINKAFFVYGTYKELKEKGLVVKEGGVLAIGKKKSLQENTSDKYFTQININDTKTIPIHAKKASLITEHPKSSYTYVQENGEIAYLEIQNPKEFWKISKYAVVEVK